MSATTSKVATDAADPKQPDLATSPPSGASDTPTFLAAPGGASVSTGVTTNTTTDTTSSAPGRSGEGTSGSSGTGGSSGDSGGDSGGSSGSPRDRDSDGSSSGDLPDGLSRHRVDSAHPARHPDTALRSHSTSPCAGTASGRGAGWHLEEPEEGSNLFVAGLARTVDDEALERTFARFGAVLSAKVMLRVSTGASRGFGFVLFSSAQEAERAMHALQGTAITGHGGRMQISASKHRGENLTAESRVVYVRNVPEALADSRRFEDFMRGFGAIEKRVSRPHERMPTVNFIFTYDSVAAARACIAGVHGKSPFPECAVPLMAKMEEPLTLREQRLRVGSGRRDKPRPVPARGPSATSPTAPALPALTTATTGGAGGTPVVTVGGVPTTAPTATQPQPPSPAPPPQTSPLPGGYPWLAPPMLPFGAFPSFIPPIPPPPMPAFPGFGHGGMPAAASPPPFAPYGTPLPSGSYPPAPWGANPFAIPRPDHTQ